MMKSSIFDEIVACILAFEKRFHIGSDTSDYVTMLIKLILNENEH